jgi:hypothetical protein
VSRNNGRGEVAKWIAVLAPSVVVYLVLRTEVLGTAASGVGLGHLLQERILRLGFVYSTYLRMMFLPQDARFFYGHVSPGMAFSAVDLALLVVPVAVAVIAARLVPFRDRGVPKQRVAALGLGWMLVALIPAADFIHTNTLLPAERFTYLPSVGACIFIGWLVWRTREWLRGQSAIIRGSVIAAGTAWALAAVFFAVNNSAYFTSNLAWARRVTETNPPHTAFRWLAADFYTQAGDARAALGEYEAMLNIESDRASATWQAAIRHKLGNTYAQVGDMTGAARAFAKAVALDTERAESWRDLGRASLRIGRFADAVTAFERQASLANPGLRDRLELGQAYKGIGDNRRAAALFQSVIAAGEGSAYAKTARLELDSM